MAMESFGFVLGKILEMFLNGCALVSCQTPYILCLFISLCVIQSMLR